MNPAASPNEAVATNGAASRYTAQLNLADPNDAHILAIGRVPANSRVLDLGAADGSVARLLADMGCRVWGVEVDPAAAEAARQVCEDIVVGDLNQLDLATTFPDQRFDVVLMLDVLEHLVEPARVLSGVTAVLAERGWGVISIPNIAHISTRLALLDGRFTYTDMGLLDRTHLRFFDRDGADTLLRDAGWGSFDLAHVTRPLGTTEIVIEDPDPDLVEHLATQDEAQTYQFVISGAPLGSSVLERPPVLPAAVAQRALMEAAVLVEKVETEAERHYRTLESEIENLRRLLVPDLDEQLEAIRQTSLVRRSHLQHLLAALQENSTLLRDRLA